ncbi:MAG TPA: nucleotidyltransferase domain-containing protein [Trebonia sp.]|nr:nucleotidyltransferase domain-containing protein [Trebonia sp.]
MPDQMDSPPLPDTTGSPLLPPDTTGSLPREAQAALEEYLTALDTALPGIAHGIYVTGSAVLGDWQPGRSDLDILVATHRALDDDQLTALETAHATIAARPYRDAIYIPARAIGARPAPAGGGDPDAADDRYPSAVDGVFQRARYRPDPVLWATLHRHALTVRGPVARTLGADPGPAWLREWNHGNLESYWRPWAARVRAALGGQDPAEVIPGFIVGWAALGPGRLHATITIGEIISKTAAADYTARLLPQYRELLARAKASRVGDDTGPFTVADGRAACDLIDAVAADAATTRA